MNQILKIHIFPLMFSGFGFISCGLEIPASEISAAAQNAMEMNGFLLVVLKALNIYI